MVSSDDKTGVIVLFVLYMVLLVAAAVYGWWVQRKRIQETKVMENAEEELASQFIAGRSLGPFITSMTMLASSFSGFTIVGIPEESFLLGWTSLKWVTLQVPIMIVWSGTGLRLRKASLVRNHQSPVDIITDRFGSQILRYTIVTLQVVPEMLYLVVQLSAINKLLNPILGFPASNPAPVVLTGVVLLGLEWLGGMSCVAYTDAIQAVILISIMLVFPVVFSHTFGGWVNLDPMTYPQPSFYQCPDTESQMAMWSTIFVAGLSSYSLPHYIQRIYAAENIKALKIGWAIGCVAPWALNLTGVFIGTMGVYILAGRDVEQNTFGAIINTFMDTGMAGYITGALLFVSGVAAIMSTADSILIAIAQVVTTEIAYPLRPNASSTEINLVGKGVSLVTMTVSLLAAIFWNEGLSAIFGVIFSLSAQTSPSMLVGLFSHPDYPSTEVHPWILAFAAWAAVVIVLADNFRQKTLAFNLDNGLLGLCCNVAIIIILQGLGLLMKKFVSVAPKISSPAWDTPQLKRFGEKPLTSTLMWKMMEGVREPLLDPYFLVLVLLLLTAMLPLTGDGTPSLNELGQLSYMPNIIAGLPDWAFAYIMFCVVLTGVALQYIWKIPNDLTGTATTTKSGHLDLSVLPLDKATLNHSRISYDGTNEAAELFRAKYRLRLVDQRENGLNIISEEENEEAGEDTDKDMVQIVPIDEDIAC